MIDSSFQLAALMAAASFAFNQLMTAYCRIRSQRLEERIIGEAHELQKQVVTQANNKGQQVLDYLMSKNPGFVDFQLKRLKLDDPDSNGGPFEP